MTSQTATVIARTRSTGAWTAIMAYRRSCGDLQALWAEVGAVHRWFDDAPVLPAGERPAIDITVGGGTFGPHVSCMLGGGWL